MYDIITVKKLNQYLNDNQNLYLNQESTAKNVHNTNYKNGRAVSTENEIPRRTESAGKKYTNTNVQQDKDRRTNRSQIKEKSPKSILNSSSLNYKKGNDLTLINKLESARSTSPYLAANKPLQTKNNLSFLNLSLQSSTKKNQENFQPTGRDLENNPFLALSSETTTSNWREITFKILLTDKEYRLLQLERAKQIKLS